MDNFRKIVCTVLVACLLLGIVPAQAMASTEAETTSSTNDTYTYEYSETDGNNAGEDNGTDTDDDIDDDAEEETETDDDDYTYNDTEPPHDEEPAALDIMANAADPAAVVVGHTNGVVTRTNVIDALAAAGIAIGEGWDDDLLPFSVTFAPGVTSIGDRAFRETALTSVTIPDSVTLIGSLAFSNAWNLTNITVDENNSSYSSRDGVLFNNDQTILIQYPAGNPRTAYTIPDSVISIGYRAFMRASFWSVTIPDNVITIGDWAFSEINSLASVVIPNSVTSIGEGAFVHSIFLMHITVDENNPNFSSRDGVLFNKNQTTLIRYAGGFSRTAYTIPNSVTSIGDWAFADATFLTSIVIPNSVTSIGNWAFASIRPTSIVIPNSVTSIGDWAFWDATSLTSVTIPNSITSIGNGVFAGTDSLTSVVIPNSVTSIGERAFWNARSLTSVVIGNSVTSIGDEAFHGTRLTSVVIPNSVTTIGDRAFWIVSSLTSVTIGNSVTSIGDSAFSGASSLTSLTIGNSVTSIGDSAFSGASSLTSVVIPNSVTSIGHEAFLGASSLRSVTVGSNVTSIGHGAFLSASSLRSATFLGNAPTYLGVVFERTHPDFRIYFPPGATGWTTPTWNGYPAFPNIFNFDTDRWHFINPSWQTVTDYYVCINIFRNLFGYVQGNAKYNAQNRGNNVWSARGHCFGMSVTTAAIFQSSPNVNTFGGHNYLVNVPRNSTNSSLEMLVPRPNRHGNIHEGDIASHRESLTAARFIKHAQTMQLLDGMLDQLWGNTSDYQGLVEEIRRGEPVTVAMYRVLENGGIRGHAVLAFAIASETQTQTVIATNDSNYPNEVIYITLYKDADGNFTGFSTPPYSYNYITYFTGTTQVLNTSLNSLAAPDDRYLIISLSFRFVYSDGINTTNIAGHSVDDIDLLMPIVTVAGDGESDSFMFWGNSDSIRISGIEEDATFSMTGSLSGISADLAANAEADITVSGVVSSIEIDGMPGDSVAVTHTFVCDDGTLATLDLVGVSSEGNGSSSFDRETLTISGINDVIVTVEIDGREYVTEINGETSISLESLTRLPSSNLGNWQQVGDNWTFALDDDTLVKDSFHQVGGNWFFFDENGFVHRGYLHRDGQTFLLGSDGVRLTGWHNVAIGGISGRRFFDHETGAMFRGARDIGSAWFAFDTASGVMRTGWVDDVEIAGATGQRYFLPGGAMARNLQSIETATGTFRFFFDQDTGVMRTGFRIVGTTPFLFLSENLAQVHSMPAGAAFNRGLLSYDMGTVQSPNLQTFFFAANGTMQQGWQTFGEHRYFFDMHGAEFQVGNEALRLNPMLTGLVPMWQAGRQSMFYFEREGGSLPVGAMVSNDWRDDGQDRYFFLLSGSAATGLHAILGDSYLFSEASSTLGRMMTGWQRVNGNWYYFHPTDVMDGNTLSAQIGSAAVGLWHLSFLPGQQAQATAPQWFIFCEQPMTRGRMLTGFIEIDVPGIGRGPHIFTANGIADIEDYTGWVIRGGSWIRFEDGLQLRDGVFYCPAQDGVYRHFRFDRNGNLMLGWQTVRIDGVAAPGNRHFFTPFGRGAPGWHDIGVNRFLIKDGETVPERGLTYYNHGSEVDPDIQWYFFAEGATGGAMRTGWINNIAITGDGRARHFFKPCGAAATGWHTFGNETIHFDVNGRVYRDLRRIEHNILGEKTDDYYFFAANGVMRTGWQNVRGSGRHYFKPCGAAATGWQVIPTAARSDTFFLAENGRAHTGTHRLLPAGGVPAATGNVAENVRWFLFANNGALRTGWHNVALAYGGATIDIRARRYFDPLEGGALAEAEWMRIGARNELFHFNSVGRPLAGTHQLVPYGETPIVVEGETVNERWFLFANNGVMRTGWHRVPLRPGGTGTPDPLQPGHTSQRRFFTRETGALASGGWYFDGRNWSHFGDTPGIPTVNTPANRAILLLPHGVQDLPENKQWFIFNSNGAMRTGQVRNIALGEGAESGTHFFTLAGANIPGWHTIGANMFFYDEDRGLLTRDTHEIRGDDGVYREFRFANNGAVRTGMIRVGSQTIFFAPPNEGDRGFATGWQQVGRNWAFVRADGTPLIGLQRIGGEQFFFDNNGIMRTGRVNIAPRNTPSVIRFFRQASAEIVRPPQLGAMVAEDWAQIGRNTHFFLNSEQVRGRTAQIGGEWYSFAAGGAIQTGWRNVALIGADEQPVAGGARAWRFFRTPAISQTDGMPVGSMVDDGWLQVGRNWFYLRPNGARVESLALIDGEHYFFARNGVMRTGWQRVNRGQGVERLYFHPLVALASPPTFGHMANDGWQQIGRNWFYFNADGNFLTDLREVRGNRYLFHRTSGAMQTGWRDVRIPQQVGRDVTERFFFRTGVDPRYMGDGAGAAVTGWQLVGNTWRFFKPDGILMRT